MPRLPIPGSVTFRLALGFGAMTLLSLALLSGMFYLGTVGTLERGIDHKLEITSRNLGQHAETEGPRAIQEEIQRLLDDGIDTDTEVYQLTAADGRPLSGNLDSVPADLTPGVLSDRTVQRAGRSSTSRLLLRTLRGGERLVVGRDLEDLRNIRGLVLQALGLGGAGAAFLAVGGALLFRRLIEQRLAAIRRTAARIGAGDLGWRVPAPRHNDEFSRLSADINIMLDRIQTLMDGVRDVSNAIAHDMRTPLGRIRARLDQSLRSSPNDAPALAEAARDAITGIDDLVGLLQRLLEIAEVEAGGRRHKMEPVNLSPLLQDLAELYDALAEDRGIALSLAVDGAPTAKGDRDLLAMAAVNLLDNACKYAGEGAQITLSAREQDGWISLAVTDDGPGIPADQRREVLKRFTRLDSSRHQPGNGLGLALVEAVVRIHGGLLELENAGGPASRPGLTVRLQLPKAI